MLLGDLSLNSLFRVNAKGQLLDRVELAPFGMQVPATVDYNPLNGHISISDAQDLFIIEIVPVQAVEAWENYE